MKKVIHAKTKYALLLAIGLSLTSITVAISAPAQKPVTVGGGVPKVVTRENYVYDNDGTILDHTLTKQNATLGKYTMYQEIVDDIGLITMKLSLGNKVLVERRFPKWQGLSEASLVLINPVSNNACTLKPMAADINGDKLPDLITSEDSGAARGPTDYRIYSLDGAGAKEIYHASLLNPDFKDLDGDGVFEVLVNDDVLEAFEDASTSQTYMPPVALAWNGKTYVPTRKLMKSEALADAKLNSLVADLKKKNAEAGKPKAGAKTIVPAVWGEMSELIYHGNIDGAKKLLKTLYPDGSKLWISTKPDAAPISRDQFWAQFEKQLATSKWASVTGFSRKEAAGK